ncbi:MAG: Tim17/Tim22/Tim23/Pmp24 family-domain-containing protein [Clostridiales bacterium]|nr:Tim17/Tim22/Tim23/Pmp24 family-domain-containing protein [Clostridiales bacterium]
MAVVDGILAFLAGAVFGGLFAALKYFLLWRPFGRGKKLRSTSAVMGRYGIGHGINIAALVTVFLFRNVLPFPFEYALIGTALALVLFGKFYPVTRYLPELKTESKPEQNPEQGSEEV